jgi:hypothetical protein
MRKTNEKNVSLVQQELLHSYLSPSQLGPRALATRWMFKLTKRCIFRSPRKTSLSLRGSFEVLRKAWLKN